MSSSRASCAHLSSCLPLQTPATQTIHIFYTVKNCVCTCTCTFKYKCISYSVIDQSSSNEEKVSRMFYRSGFILPLFLELQRRGWITGHSLEAFCMFVMRQNLKQLMIREKSSRKGEKLLQRRQEVTWTISRVHNLLAIIKFLVMIIINS